MKNLQEIKNKLSEACLLFVDEKHNTVTSIIESNKKALFSETKSSAGDKHETGRAMLQLEMEKASQQLAVIFEMKEVLAKIEIQKISKIICLGSLIITNKASYFLAISAGKITIENTDYYAVSTNSPIGKQLLGKATGSIIPFNEAEILAIY
ncbi:3-oxoacyl-ACP synthase [uncultured Lutibacter sp.]|uniref:3-oxoacyl-ACP synthase n=1 Tax=uncultured Lutibacter sp. TaxID=437739 RepID=UPI0026297513|nr:3-oxoacyl-ACP synthase [uncultured Lutibacter sp.]